MNPGAEYMPRTHLASEAADLVRSHLKVGYEPGVAYVEPRGRLWNQDLGKVSAWAWESACGVLSDISARDSRLVVDYGDRYVLTEPLDVEVNANGFVVWSAADWEVSRLIPPDLSLDQWQHSPGWRGVVERIVPGRPRVFGLNPKFRPLPLHIDHDPAVPEPFRPPNQLELDSIADGGPICGLVEFGSFPLLDHGFEGPASGDLNQPAI